VRPIIQYGAAPAITRRLADLRATPHALAPTKEQDPTVRDRRRSFLALAGTVLVAGLVCTGCRSQTSSVDENRINLVADDPVFDEPAPRTTEEIFSVSPAEEFSGHFSPGHVTANHSGTADLHAARWWFMRLEHTGWTVNEVGGVHCGRGSYTLSASKNFDDDQDRFLAGIIVVVEGTEVRVAAQIGASQGETPGGGDVGEGQELAATCLSPT
tara:strand:- start:91 stop:729 length:639 start_codon:yes stop_codon:yes gene_type:complete